MTLRVDGRSYGLQRTPWGSGMDSDPVGSDGSGGDHDYVNDIWPVALFVQLSRRLAPKVYSYEPVYMLTYEGLVRKCPLPVAYSYIRRELLRSKLQSYRCCDAWTAETYHQSIDLGLTVRCDRLRDLGMQ